MNDKFQFEVKKQRPEEKFKSVLNYFRGETLHNYATSKSLMRIQERITKRALELLDIENESLILDAGCGAGFSSIYLKEKGYKVVSLDLIKEFLYFYNLKEINPLAGDMCKLAFQPESFDAIVSISALQWIYRDLKYEKGLNNLVSLIRGFHESLKPDGKVIFQFYPKSSKLMDNISSIIKKNSDFTGKYIIDNPDSPKKRKIYLILKK
ncbi:MAG: class I SAM-dependent methyltransferase [Promethearchaeia archaeon]